MKIAITGAGGMLGSTLASLLVKQKHDVQPFNKAALDVTDYNKVMATLCSIDNLNLVIHCAAYTKVDLAESEPEIAFAVNGYGTENVAIGCAKINVPMLYISTDYVFDGEKGAPYTTWDETNPLSVYGKSKLAGEISIARHLKEFYIVRTSWLYGPNGKNFVDTMLELAKKGEPLKVVSDQIGSPTSTLSLSKMIGELINKQRFGVYHASDEGVASWFDFAQAITKNSGVEVKAISTAEMKRPARRPKFSVLDKTTLISTLDHPLATWQESLQSYLELRTGNEVVV